MLNIATTADPIRKRRERLEDAPFIDALDFDFRNATTIARHMLANGTPTTLGAIAKRMAEFVRYTDVVEAEGAAWRLVAANNDLPPTPPTPAKEIAPRNRKARRAATAVETIEATPANDNPATVLPIGLHQMCGLELMRSLPDASIDLLLTDLPYGSTRSKFDPKIDVAKWMAEMRRIVTPRGAILAFCAQPFTTALMNVAGDLWKTDIVWHKPNATGVGQSHRRLMKAHETILVFSKGTVCGGERSKRHMTFNPQGAEAYISPNRKHTRTHYLGQPFSSAAAVGEPVNRLRKCPRDVVFYPKDKNTGHSFSKPIALLDMLIKTYSNDGDVVLDPTMGSGSTGVACSLTGRQFIGAENGYKKDGSCIFTIAKDRIASHSVANDNAKPSKPRRKVKPVVKPMRPLQPEVQPDDEPLPMLIPPF